MTNVNVSEVVKRAVAGDQAAMIELHDLQKQGRGLRVYPFGRKSPTEDGMSPVLFDRGDSGMVRLRIAKPGYRLEFMDKDIAGVIRQQLTYSSLAFVELAEELGSPTKARQHIKQHTTRGLEIKTGYGERGIYLEVQPALNEVQYGVDIAYSLVDRWIEVIGATYKEPTEFGFIDFEEWMQMIEHVNEVTGFGEYES